MIPLVLIPGMMCDGRLFNPQSAALSGERAIQLAPISAHDNVAALAQDILDNAPPTFAVAGLSMGGIVAMEMMRRSPERIERLALLDTNPLAETDLVRAGRLPQMEKVRNGRLENVMREEMKPNYLSDGPHKSAVLDLCMSMAKSLGPDVFLRQSTALANRPDQTDALRSATVPTLVLCGEDDILCPLARHQLMHQLVPHSTLEVISNAGHLPTLEQPEQTTAALIRWLEY
jgi:pimeloyl-ACP methyl ester carboxylesterase